MYIYIYMYIRIILRFDLVAAPHFGHSFGSLVVRPVVPDPRTQVVNQSSPLTLTELTLGRPGSVALEDRRQAESGLFMPVPSCWIMCDMYIQYAHVQEKLYSGSLVAYVLMDCKQESANGWQK